MRDARSSTMRIQRYGEEVLQAGDGGDVRPGPPGEQVRDRLPVHPGSGGGLTQAQPLLGESFGEAAGDLPHRLRPDILGAETGPGFRIVGQIPRGAHAGASADHARTILSVEVDQSPDGCLTSRYSWIVVLDPDTSAKIARYRPRQAPAAWDDVAPLVRSIVAATVTAVPYGTERLLHVTASLALWAEANGLPRDPDTWLRGEVIDAYVLSRAGSVEPTSVQTYRTWLRRVRDALAWTDRGEPVPPKLHAPANPHAPYEKGELAGLRQWASRLRGQQRSDALALMALGSGLGLMPREIAAARGRHLRRVGPGHPLVHTGVERSPLVAREGWEDVLAELVGLAGGYLFRPGRTTPYAKNLISGWSLTHQPPADLPALSAGRFRATWIVELMTERIDHALIARAAGLASAASLARYQHFVPPLDDATAIRLLRGRPA